MCVLCVVRDFEQHCNRSGLLPSLCRCKVMFDTGVIVTFFSIFSFLSLSFSFSTRHLHFVLFPMSPSEFVNLCICDFAVGFLRFPMPPSEFVNL
jgi:predicted AAA+ superfamily ATPase